MTGPAHDAPLELAAAYALGALSPDEAQRFEAFLATSAEARREVAEYREVAALLALGGEEAAPGEALRERVLARIGEGKTQTLPPAGPAKGREVPWLALAASLLLAVGLGAGLVSARGRLAAVETELAARDRTLAQTRQQLAERQATLNSILEPGVPSIVDFPKRERDGRCQSSHSFVSLGHHGETSSRLTRQLPGEQPPPPIHTGRKLPAKRPRTVRS